jgi:hypothetical protein
MQQKKLYNGSGSKALLIMLLLFSASQFGCQPTEQAIQTADGEGASASEALTTGALTGNAWESFALLTEGPEAEVVVSAESFSSEDFDKHLKKLDKIIPSKDFTVVVQAPFVVIGDETPDQVRGRAVSTVQWATEMLKQDYFPKDPQKIIDIWLFKDNASYRKHTKELFHDNVDTPFGYFSELHNALIMNIGTGGGTLVHEMVHAFMKPNFPQCPAWFNEGLASLYEQCHAVDGRIMGLTNWRLSGLQTMIRERRTPSFKSLVNSTSSEF